MAASLASCQSSLGLLDDDVWQVVAEVLSPYHQGVLSTTCKRWRSVTRLLPHQLNLTPQTILDDPGLLARLCHRFARAATSATLVHNRVLHPKQLEHAFRRLTQAGITRLKLHDAVSWYTPVQCLNALAGLESLEWLPQGSQELEPAIVSQHEQSLSQLSALTSLRKLCVRWMLGDMPYFDMPLLDAQWLRQLTNLTHLKLGWVRYSGHNSLLQGLAPLQALRVLVIYGDMSRLSASCLVHLLLTGSLPHLCKLELVHRFSNVYMNMDEGLVQATADQRLAEIMADLLDTNVQVPGSGTASEESPSQAGAAAGISGDAALPVLRHGLRSTLPPLSHLMLPVAPLTAAFAPFLALLPLRHLFVQHIDGVSDLQTLKGLRGLTQHRALVNLQLDALPLTPALCETLMGMAPSLTRLVIFNGLWRCDPWKGPPAMGLHEPPPGLLPLEDADEMSETASSLLEGMDEDEATDAAAEADGAAPSGPGAGAGPGLATSAAAAVAATAGPALDRGAASAGQIAQEHAGAFGVTGPAQAIPADWMQMQQLEAVHAAQQQMADLSAQLDMLPPAMQGSLYSAAQAVQQATAEAPVGASVTASTQEALQMMQEATAAVMAHWHQGVNQVQAEQPHAADPAALLNPLPVVLHPGLPDLPPMSQHHVWQPASSGEVTPCNSSLECLGRLSNLTTLCIDLGEQSAAVLMNAQTMSPLTTLSSLTSLHLSSAWPIAPEPPTQFDVFPGLKSFSISTSKNLAYPRQGLTLHPYELDMTHLPRGLHALCLHGVQLVWPRQPDVDGCLPTEVHTQPQWPPTLRHLWLAHATYPGLAKEDVAGGLPRELETLVVKLTPGGTSHAFDEPQNAWAHCLGRFHSLITLGISGMVYRADLKHVRGLPLLQTLLLGYEASPAEPEPHLSSRWLVFLEDLMECLSHPGVMPGLRSLMIPTLAGTHLDMLTWQAQLAQVCPHVTIRTLQNDHIWKLPTPCGVPDIPECLDWWHFHCYNTL